MTFSSIPIKGQDFKESHILSFVSPSASALAEIRDLLLEKSGMIMLTL